MSKTAVYHTTVQWQGEHWGHIIMGNGPEMPFSAPPDAQGHPDVFTPEDAFVAAINTCIMMMFTELPLLERPAAAAAAGFDAVEFWWPFDSPVPADRGRAIQ